MRQAALLAVVCVLVGSRCYAAGAPAGPPNLPALAQLALSDDEFIRTGAIESLRQAGPAGLEALFQAHRVTIARVLASKPNETSVDDTIWQRVRNDLDTVAGQRDCYTSHLYWYTDLEAAKAAARAQHKPILSLRLLGKLTDEYSCANSRFFRSALYTNAEVGRALRERFVLHWQSERPVPIVTIDFGDGRKLQRTVTGNSVHYILDAEGEPLDALPGLYGPKAFLSGIERAEQLYKTLKPLHSREWKQQLTSYHRDRLKELREQWNVDLEKLEHWDAAKDQLDFSAPPPHSSQAAKRVQKLLAAQAKGPAAVAAVAVNQRAIDRGNVMTSESPLQATLKDESLWLSIAELHAADAALDAASCNEIARKTPPAVLAGQIAVTKRATETPLLRLVRSFQQTIAIDTVRNEYLLHREIHRWYLANNERGINFKELNQRVYSELFLTPKSDPWLGLMPPDVYSAIEGGGLSEPPATDTALTGTQRVQ